MGATPPVQALVRKTYLQLKYLPTWKPRAKTNDPKLLPPSLRSVATETGCSHHTKIGITISTMPTTRKRPGTPTAGMRIRARWAPIVATGTVTCDRCHEPIKPGEPFDIGHPVDAPYAAGNHDWNTCRPQHVACNRSGIVLPPPEPTFSW